jgi:hypothetical protein
MTKHSKAVTLILLLALWTGILLGLPGSPHPGADSRAQAANNWPIYLPLISNLAPRNTPFGLETHSSFTNTYVSSYTKDLKVGAVRMGVRISWRLLQPVEGGPIQWGLLANVDQELRILNAADVDAVLVITDSPLWAVIRDMDDLGKWDFNGDGILEPRSIDEDGDGNGDGKSYCGAIAQDKFDDFAEFMRQLVLRYSTPEYNVKIWELGNEPDVDPIYVPGDAVYGCWGDQNDGLGYNGAHYGKMLKVVTPAVKAADPGAQVWVGGLLLSTPDPLVVSNRFLTGILAEGAAPYFDAVPYHWYAWFYNTEDVKRDLDLDFDSAWKDWGGGSYGKAVFLKGLLSEYQVSKPLVMNEVALGCTDRIVNDLCSPLKNEFLQSQANFTPRAALRALKAGVSQVDWFVLEENTWGYVGLLDVNRNPKPVYGAYRNLIAQYNNGTFNGEYLGYGPGVEAYEVLRRDGRRLHVVWSRSYYTVPTITVPQAQLVEIVGRDGEAITSPAPTGGVYTISVGFSPIYLILTP